MGDLSDWMHAIRGRLDDVRRERAEAQAESDAWLARVDQLDTEESHLNALLALQAEHPSQEIRVDRTPVVTASSQAARETRPRRTPPSPNRPFGCAWRLTQPSRSGVRPVELP